MKTLDENFIDWESHVFGFGYGSGEGYILTALKALFEAIPEKGTYDYEALEKQVTPTVAWLLINVLCRADIFEYGTSPRFGWLTAKGTALRDYLASKTIDEVVSLVTGYDENYVPCYPDHCNCDEEKCKNPFWKEHQSR